MDGGHPALSDSLLPRPFPPGVAEKLGTYVYALRDPRTKSIFYVGKGKGARVYSHVWSVLGRSDLIDDQSSEDTKPIESAKNARIKDIHASGSAVEHFIVTHQIAPEIDDNKSAFRIEQALIDAFRLIDDSDSPVLTNIAGGHTPTKFGVLPIGELISQYGAKPAPPLTPPCALVISRDPMTPYWTKADLYENSRKWWFARNVIHIPDLPVFVLHRDLIRSVYRAESWDLYKGGPKTYRFTGKVDTELEADYVGRSLKPADVGLKGWSTRGWHRFM